MTRATIKHLDADAFSNVSDLHALDLRGNMLTYLPSEIFSNMTGLVTLHLDDNHLLELDNTVFRGLKNMMTLTLSGNRLVHIRYDTFADLYSLRLLDLSNNAFTNLSDKAFGESTVQFTSLTYVNLSHNFLDQPPSLMWYLPSLLYLDLSYNNITFSGIASCANGFRAFRPPHSYCGISPELHLHPLVNKGSFEIDMTYNHITGMDLLRLDAHAIQSICVFLFFFRAYLSGNDVVCDCNVFSLYDLLRKSEGHYSKIFCSQPMHSKTTNCSKSMTRTLVVIVMSPVAPFTNMV